MSTKDLFEMACLDAFGLLDEKERRAFEDAFAAAHPQVKAQVRNAQARFADVDDFLPDVSPPVTLRQRVLSAVQQVVMEADRSHVRAGILPSRGVSALWRAGAIGCAAASIVFGVATLQMQHRYSELDAAIRNNQVSELFAKDFGKRFETLLSDNHTKFVQFASVHSPSAGTPAPTHADSAAVLLLDPATKTGQLFCRNLPDAKGGQYNLVILDEKGNVKNVVMTLRTSGSKSSEEIKGLELKSGTSLGIATIDGAETATPVLKSMSL